MIKNKKFQPRKRFSQNFLNDKSVLKLISQNVSAKKGDGIIEIGAGQGQLTDYLLNTGAQVLGVEIDNQLADFLNQRYLDNPNFELIHQDILTVDIPRLVERSNINNWHLISNLPYHILSPVFFKILPLRFFFKQILILVQKEFALRISTQIGGLPKKNLSAISVASYGAFYSKIIFDIEPKFFSPAPKVLSALVELKPKPAEFDAHTEKQFIEFARKLYLHRRKKLLNSLKTNYPNHPALLKLDKYQAIITQRPEDLTWQQWKIMFALFN